MEIEGSVGAAFLAVETAVTDMAMGKQSQLIGKSGNEYPGSHQRKLNADSSHTFFPKTKLLYEVVRTYALRSLRGRNRR